MWLTRLEIPLGDYQNTTKLAHMSNYAGGPKQKLSEYSPHMKVSLEETMVAYTGRFVFKQYFPLKPTKRGKIGCEPIQTMDM